MAPAVGALFLRREGRRQDETECTTVLSTKREGGEVAYRDEAGEGRRRDGVETLETSFKWDAPRNLNPNTRARGAKRWAVWA